MRELVHQRIEQGVIHLNEFRHERGIGGPHQLEIMMKSLSKVKRSNSSIDVDRDLDRGPNVVVNSKQNSTSD